MFLALPSFWKEGGEIQSSDCVLRTLAENWRSLGLLRKTAT